MDIDSVEPCPASKPVVSQSQMYPRERSRRNTPARRTAMRLVTTLGLALFVVESAGQAQSSSARLPRFADYPAADIFAATPAAPRIVTPAEKAYAREIRTGVTEGLGVFRNGKEQKGPNFAGRLIVIQWGCGSPCLRMAIVDAQTGDVYYPPISINGLAALSFDLPVLRARGSAPQNPIVEFRLDSNLLIVRATPGHTDRANTYYFLWQGGWRLLRRAPFD